MKKYEQYSKDYLIFTDERKREEWEELDASLRKNIFYILHKSCEKLEIKICIEMLCNVIIDMDLRIKELEKKNVR